MKLQCQVEVVNRLLSTLNVPPRGRKSAKSTLALGKECKKENEYLILLFTAANKSGVKYRVNNNIMQVFTKYLVEGKSTIRFKEPAHDLVIKCETIQLTTFMKLLSACLSGKNVNLSNLSNISVTGKDQAPTRLIIKDRSEIPSNGLPRTLQSLYMNGLKLCNFRREILQLRNLSVLDLRNNELEKIPVEFGRMPCITELYLENNQLGVRGEVDWRWLMGPQLSKTLRLLDLRGNALGYIPNSIWKLDGLRTLKLDNNMLTSIPASLGRIHSLRYLTLASNKLKCLPCSIMKIRLDYIDLSSNPLRESSEESIEPSHSPWDLYVGDLVQISGAVVLKNKIQYDSRTIPRTLVEFLDESCFCICGAPSLGKKVYKKRKFEPKDYFTEVVLDGNANSVIFDCHFCSNRCFSRWG